MLAAANRGSLCWTRLLHNQRKHHEQRVSGPSFKAYLQALFSSAMPTLAERLCARSLWASCLALGHMGNPVGQGLMCHTIMQSNNEVQPQHRHVPKCTLQDFPRREAHDGQGSTHKTLKSHIQTVPFPWQGLGKGQCGRPQAGVGIHGQTGFADQLKLLLNKATDT
jgi:hypothetical protein